jgi:hypothetical protein
MAEAPDYRLQNRRHLEQRRRYEVESRPGGGPSNLADILERVLDKGIVIAGDIQINLLDIELLTIKLRLLVASVDRAKEMGINWWESDPTLSRGAEQLEQENRQLRERLERLEQAIGVGDGVSASSRELPAGDASSGGSDRADTQGSRSGREARPTARSEEPADGRSESPGSDARG